MERRLPMLDKWRGKGWNALAVLGIAAIVLSPFYLCYRFLKWVFSD